MFTLCFLSFRPASDLELVDSLVAVACDRYRRNIRRNSARRLLPGHLDRCLQDQCAPPSEERDRSSFAAAAQVRTDAAVHCLRARADTHADAQVAAVAL